jgi:transposase
VGLDLSDKTAHFHVLRGDGHTLSTGKVATKPAELEAFFSRWKGCRLVIEAGSHSPWISRLGTACGLEVVVANPRQVELISKSDRKTDRTDAERLADLGRTNPKLLAPITHRSKQAQIDLCVMRARDELVHMRTALINHVRGVLKSYGHRAPDCSPESFARQALASIPEELETGLRTILDLISNTNQKIRSFDDEIERLSAGRYAVTQVLRQIPGVGPVIALTFVLTLGDPKRFPSARAVGAYLGLVPRKKSSGKSDPQLSITKAGDRQMRRLLVIAANYILGSYGPDCDLKRFGEKIAGDGSNRAAKKRARVAVARKLAVLMYHLWRTGAAYDPLYLAKARSEPARA